MHRHVGEDRQRGGKLISLHRDVDGGTVAACIAADRSAKAF
ncbi:hypothetical protein QP185_04050 [Sphingomonas aerolata]